MCKAKTSNDGGPTEFWVLLPLTDHLKCSLILFTYSKVGDIGSLILLECITIVSCLIKLSLPYVIFISLCYFGVPGWVAGS